MNIDFQRFPVVFSKCLFKTQLLYFMRSNVIVRSVSVSGKRGKFSCSFSGFNPTNVSENFPCFTDSQDKTDNDEDEGFSKATLAGHIVASSLAIGLASAVA